MSLRRGSSWRGGCTLSETGRCTGSRPILPRFEAIAKAARPFASVDTALCVPSILIERAARAVPGFSYRWSGRPFCRAKARIPDAPRPRCSRMRARRLTIVGHSERREAQRETDEEVTAKAEAALASGLSVILCVGESLTVREAGKAISTVEEQLRRSIPQQLDAPDRLAIAYEPIWAIGTGKIAATRRHWRDARSHSAAAGSRLRPTRMIRFACSMAAL